MAEETLCDSEAMRRFAGIEPGDDRIPMSRGPWPQWGRISPEGLCCTNPVRDSSCESSVVAGRHEQTHTPRLQDPELA